MGIILRLHFFRGGIFLETSRVGKSLVDGEKLTFLPGRFRDNDLITSLASSHSSERGSAGFLAVDAS